MNLLEFKQHELSMLKKFGENDKSYKYHKWILDNSIYSTNIDIKTSKNISKNCEIKECYANCYRNISGFRYFEGYVFNKRVPIPLEHAYLMNDKNQVIDPTLAISVSRRKAQAKKYNLGYVTDFDHLTGNEYLGIEIPRDTLYKMLLKRKTFDNNLIEMFLNV